MAQIADAAIYDDLKEALERAGAYIVPESEIEAHDVLSEEQKAKQLGSDTHPAPCGGGARCSWGDLCHRQPQSGRVECPEVHFG